jgi:hypothetical protein
VARSSCSWILAVGAFVAAVSALFSLKARRTDAQHITLSRL